MGKVLCRRPVPKIQEHSRKLIAAQEQAVWSLCPFGGWYKDIESAASDRYLDQECSALAELRRDRGGTVDSTEVMGNHDGS